MDGVDRRTAIADAAIELLANEGSRALTHRAIDRALGLSVGSTSFYFRTRRALLEAAALRIADLAAAEVPVPMELESGARKFAATIERWASPASDLHKIARIELLLEARRRPEFANILDSARMRMLSEVSTALKTFGAAHDERTVKLTLATLDGILLDRLFHPRIGLQPEDLAPVIRALFKGPKRR